MWPNLLDLTKDDCRGILRRSELEAYSQVISTFRAQGSLNEKKSKILKELREIFHINEDRHKAEIRRASNDEELCTIAEKISGPNTGQEWRMEGRRRYPLIPRDTTLHTAFSVIANSAVQDVITEALVSDNIKNEPRKNLPLSTYPVVTEDPFSVVNIKSAEMKFSRSPKKRSIERDYSTQPLHTNTRIQQLYHSHSVGGRIPAKQRKIQSKRHLSIKGKVPMNKPAHRKKLATVPNVTGATLSEQKQKQKKQTGPPKQENVITPPDTAWTNEIIDATAGPPVQIVYTTQNPTLSLQNVKDDGQNNLITESTPITWLNRTTTTIQNNRIQSKAIVAKNSHLIIGENNVTNSAPRRNFGVNIIEDITLDQLCNIEKSPQVTSSTHLVSDPGIPLLPNSNTFPSTTGIVQTNIIGPSKPKIQITNQQIFSNKMPIIKPLQSKGNVTLIKQDGRMVIKTPSDLHGGSAQKPIKNESKMEQLIKAVSLTPLPNNLNQLNSNKISLQKLQLVMPNKARGTPNMVKVFTSSQQLQSSFKDKILLPVSQSQSDIVLSGSENVVVLGVCQTNDSANTSNITITDSLIDKNAHVITEDTPIDIISSEEIGKFDKQKNVPFKSTQLLKHLKSQPVKKIANERTKGIAASHKPHKTIVVTESIDISEDNDVVSSTDWEMELDHVNNCKTQEQDNTSELSNIVEDVQNPIESYFHAIDDDETDDIIQYDASGSPSSLLNEADKM